MIEYNSICLFLKKVGDQQVTFLLMFEQIREQGLVGFTAREVPVKASHDDHFYRAPLKLFFNSHTYAFQMIFSLRPKVLEMNNLLSSNLFNLM